MICSGGARISEMLKSIISARLGAQSPSFTEGRMPLGSLLDPPLICLYTVFCIKYSAPISRYLHVSLFALKTNKIYVCYSVSLSIRCHSHGHTVLWCGYRSRGLYSVQYTLTYTLHRNILMDRLRKKIIFLKINCSLSYLILYTIEVSLLLEW
jgi:hypothetical protein